MASKTSITIMQDPPMVCRVTPDGDVICEKGTEPEQPTLDAITRSNLTDALDAAFPGAWGPNKIKLALAILKVLADTELPDSPNIPRRSAPIVDSVFQLLAPIPPAILLYNFSELPANVMGAYFLNKADLVRMQRMFQLFQFPAES